MLLIFFLPSLTGLISILSIPQKALAQAKNQLSIPALTSSPSSSLQQPAPSSSPSPPSSSSLSTLPQSSPPTSSPSITTTLNKFQTYQNPILGLKIEYPSNWLLKEHPYNATGNSTIASFISPAPAAPSGSQLAQNSFVPYVDIFVFDSKNTPLDQLVNGSVNNNSLSNATISQSKPITLSSGKPARLIEYSIKIADRYLFDRTQVWTENGSKVFVISYTSEPQTYLAYLPTMEQMIKSLQIASPPRAELSKPVSASDSQTSGSNATTTLPSSSSSTIPWLP